MYRLLSWTLNIVLFYQGIVQHKLSFLVSGIVVLALMVIAAPFLMTLDEEDEEVSPPV